MTKKYHNEKHSDAPNDAFLREQLENFESQVPEGLFDKLAERRADGTMRERLNAYSAELPIGLFESIISDRNLSEQLNAIESDVPTPLFDAILADRTLRDSFNSTESEVPNALFDKLINRRTDADWRNKLNNFESTVPTNLFDNLQEYRDDNDISDRLAAYKSPIKPYVFDKIMDKREKRRRRFFAYWRWASAAAVLLLLGSAFWLLESQKEGAFFEINAHNTEGGGISDSKIQMPNLDISGGGNSENKQIETSNFHTNAVVSADNKRSNNASFTHEFLKPINKNQTVEISHQMSASSRLKSEISHQKSYILEHKLLETEPKAAAAQQISPNTVEKTPAASQEGGGGSATNNIKTTPLGTTVNLAENTQNTPPQYIRTVVAVPSLPLFLAVLPIKIDKKNPCKSEPGDRCPSFRTPNFGSSFGRPTINLEIFGAPEYASRRWQIATLEAEKLMRYRDSMERPWVSYSTGARVAFVFENGTSLRIGGRYNQINEIAIRDSFGVDRILTKIDSFRNPDGTWNVTLSKEIISGTFRTTRYNRYCSIDLPIELGYQVPLNDNWTLSTHLGVSINLSAWRKVHIADENGHLQAVISGTPLQKYTFSNSLGLSVLGSVAISRYLGNGFHVFVEPSVRHGFKPITRPDYPLRQSYTTAGLNMGVRLQFGSE